jgi:ParB-like chromosome segregation protein Spo0J
MSSHVVAMVPHELETEPETTRRQVPVEAIVTDPDLQPRAKIDRPTVARYAEMLRDGVALPPVELVTDGQSIWLADGFHRVFAHEDAGLAQIEAIVRQGDKLDALRISLRANFQHGRPRTEKDLDRAYQKAVRFELVDPGDIQGVRTLLACSSRKAEELTKPTRDARESERRRRMVDLWQQDKTLVQIGGELGIDRTTVSRTLQKLGFDTDRRGQRANAHGAQTHVALSPAPDDDTAEPEQLDIEDAIAASPAEPAPALPSLKPAVVDDLDSEDEPDDESLDPDHDPVAAYEAERALEAPARRMWGDSLRALEEFAKLPSPDQLFAERCVKFDYLFGAALTDAQAWFERFKKLWDAATPEQHAACDAKRAALADEDGPERLHQAWRHASEDERAAFVAEHADELWRLLEEPRP